MTTFLEQPTPFLFFTGKGGVGKTSLACATAIRLADAGKLVLLVSTDPASNLDQMLGVPLTNRPTPIAGVTNLWALNIDPETAANEYRERVVAPFLPQWTTKQIAELREQLAGACTVEIAAFDEFIELLSSGTIATAYDHIIFDTAPTGHTLRLLRLPQAWTGYLQSSLHDVSCLGPHAGLKNQQARFAAAMAALADTARTTVVLVTRPDAPSLREAERTSREIAALGLSNQQLAINAVFNASVRDDRVALALEARGAEAVRQMPETLAALPTLRVPLRPFALLGVSALRATFDDRKAAPLQRGFGPQPIPAVLPLAKLIDELEPQGHGLIMVMGKGGVGKTTIAASIAAELASRGHAVHLSTTDPAAHLAATLAGQLDHLTLARIDPAVETEAYIARVMATRGAKLADADRALLAEELRSPCYEEVAVFAAFSRTILQARTSFVVLDTAPTGHTLLLLDATGAYHRQIAAGEAHDTTGHVITPLMRLQDPSYTKMILVTLAEATPVSEAARLQADLRRAKIEPFAWVINASLAAAGSGDPCIKQRIEAELQQMALVRVRHATRLAVVPWMTEEPVGPAKLLAIARAR
jgi:arsenite-transporting ATPase